MDIRPLSPVLHKRSLQQGRAIEFNSNKNDPAWFVKWNDGSENWFKPDDLSIDRSVS